MRRVPKEIFAVIKNVLMEKLSLGVGNKTIKDVMSVQVCHNVKSQRDQSSTFSHDAI